MDDVLDKKQVDSHLILVLIRHLGHTSKESVVVVLVIKFFAVVGEIQLEWRIRDDEIKLPQTPPLVFVERMQNGIALDDIRDRMNQVVENQVEAQQAGRFLGNILREYRAAVLADRVGEIHEQRAGAGRGIVTTDIFRGLGDEASRHDFGHGVGRVVLGILAAAVLVVVLDQVLEQSGEEVEFFGEDVLEREVDHLVDDGARELVIFRCDEFSDGIKEHDFLAVLSFDRKDFRIQRGNGEQCSVNSRGELFLVLFGVQR